MQMWEGYRWRQEQQENIMAYFTACQMSVHTKKPVSPKEILKPLKKRVMKKSKSEDEKYLRKKFKLPQGGEV